MDNPIQLNMNHVNAQQARRIIDRLVGYKLSPLLWNNIALDFAWANFGILESTWQAGLSFKF